MITILIDGNNLIHKNPILKKEFLRDKSSAMLSLVEIINSRTSKSEKYIIVFDGHSDMKKSNVIFSKDTTADEVIRKRIEDFENYKLLKVVSSDRNITALAKACGCSILTSEEFWKQIDKGKSVTAGKNINQNYIYDELEKPDRMSKKEIDEFKKYFT